MDTLAPPGADPDTTAAAVIDAVPQLMRWIRTANRATTGTEVTVPQSRVLMHLRRTPGIGVSAVAEHLGIGLASASALVDRLVRRGLVVRAQDPDERRRVILTLTEEGVTRLAAATDATRRHLARALANRTPSERASIATAMGLLLDSVAGWDPDPTADDLVGHLTPDR
jgi:DNA-binding MarR family transcriptional regulator